MSTPTSVSICPDINNSKHGNDSSFGDDVSNQKAHITPSTESLTDESFTKNNSNIG